jgi:pyruvate ferredoxin oxidoreductase gamma subunit
MIEIRWHGRGGQGGFTAARLLGMAAALFENQYALAFPAFGPERRGAPVLGFTKIDHQKITDRSEVESCDYVVVLDETLMGPHIWKGLKTGGKLVINAPDESPLDLPASIATVRIDATKLAQDCLGQTITNTAMLGALLAVSGLVSCDSACKALETAMPSGLAKKNSRLLRQAYEMTLEKTK